MEIFLLSKKIWDSGKDIKGMKKDMKERMCYLGGSNVERAQDPDWNLGCHWPAQKSKCFQALPF